MADGGVVPVEGCRSDAALRKSHFSDELLLRNIRSALYKRREEREREKEGERERRW